MCFATPLPNPGALLVPYIGGANRFKPHIALFLSFLGGNWPFDFIPLPLPPTPSTSGYNPVRQARDGHLKVNRSSTIRSAPRVRRLAQQSNPNIRRSDGLCWHTKMQGHNQPRTPDYVGVSNRKAIKHARLPIAGEPDLCAIIRSLCLATIGKLAGLRAGSTLVPSPQLPITAGSFTGRQRVIHFFRLPKSQAVRGPRMNPRTHSQVTAFHHAYRCALSPQRPRMFWPPIAHITVVFERKQHVRGRSKSASGTVAV